MHFDLIFIVAKEGCLSDGGRFDSIRCDACFTHHPTCRPVAEKVSPVNNIVMVRSHMPGREAKLVCPAHRGESLPAESSSFGGACTMYL